MSDEDTKPFSWQEAAICGDTVIKSVSAVAVYMNPHNEIVIRQQGQFGDDEDSVIVIPKDRIKDLIAALENML